MKGKKSAAVKRVSQRRLRKTKGERQIMIPLNLPSSPREVPTGEVPVREVPAREVPARQVPAQRVKYHLAHRARSVRE
jgi:hypothetical protein